MEAARLSRPVYLEPASERWRVVFTVAWQSFLLPIRNPRQYCRRTPWAMEAKTTTEGHEVNPSASRLQNAHRSP